MSSYPVRPAEERDAQQVASVHATSSHAAYEGIAPEAPQSLPMAKRLAFWKDAIEYGEPLVQVLLDEGGRVGRLAHRLESANANQAKMANETAMKEKLEKIKARVLELMGESARNQHVRNGSSRRP